MPKPRERFHNPMSSNARRFLRSALTVVAVAALIGAKDATMVHGSPAEQGQLPAEVLATSDIEPSRDTFVSSERSNDNFGGQNRLWVGQRPGFEATRTLIFFDVSDLPKDQAITRAELRMTLREAGPAGDAARDLVLRRVTDSWRQDGATWNNFPGFAEERIASTAVGTSLGAKTWRSDELTTLAQRWRWPDWQSRYRRNHGLYLQGYEGEQSRRGFESDEGSDKPVLRLTHVKDDRAPRADLEHLPAFINTLDPEAPDRARIDLRWTFEDPEPATGVDFLRLLSSVGDGPLTVIADKLRQTSFSVRVRNGHRVGFAIQAVDMAGNVERQEPAETTTLVDFSPPVVSVAALPEFVSGPFVVQWGGHDEPRGEGLEASGIATYDLFYTINNVGWGTLKLGTTETSMVFTPVDGVHYGFRARGIDRAGNMQPVGGAQAGTLADMQPPVVRFTPVTGIDSEVFSVRWEVIDPGVQPSGPGAADLQYNIDGGPWLDWIVDTLDRERTFSGSFSHVYGFRARARDRAGNEGAWPSRAQLVVGVIDRDILTSKVHLPIAVVQ